MEILITGTAVILLLLISAWLVMDRTVFWLPLTRDYRSLSTRAYVPGREWTGPGNDKAVLLLHEFAGTPESFYHLGPELLKAGYDAYAPALPLSAVKADDWHAVKDQPSYSLWLPFALDRYNELKVRYKKVYVVGASLGGSVGLGLCLEVKPAGVVTISSPLVLIGTHYRKAFQRNLMIVLSVFFSLACRFLKTRVSSPAAAKLEHVSGVEGLLPVRAVHDQKVMLKRLYRRLRMVRTPALVMHARGDLTVDPANARRIWKGLGSSLKILEMLSLPPDDPTRRHRIAGHEATRQEVAAHCIAFLDMLERDSAGASYY